MYMGHSRLMPGWFLSTGNSGDFLNSLSILTRVDGGMVQTVWRYTYSLPSKLPSSLDHLIQFYPDDLSRFSPDYFHD